MGETTGRAGEEEEKPPRVEATGLATIWVPYLTCPWFEEADDSVCPAGFGRAGPDLDAEGVVAGGGAALAVDDGSCWLNVENPVDSGCSRRGLLANQPLERGK